MTKNPLGFFKTQKVKEKPVLTERRVIDLKFSAFQITAANRSLRSNGREPLSIAKYLKN